MKEKKLFGRLIGHTFNFGIGRILPQLIGFLLIPIYTRYLTPEDYGIVELATSLSAFLIIFMRLGIPGAVTRFYYDYSEGKGLQNYLTTIFIFLIIIGFFIGLGILMIGYFWSDSLIKGLPYYPFYFLIVATAFLSANTDLQRRLIQVREQSKYAAVLSTVTALVGIVSAIILVVVFEMGALGMVWASTISAIVFFIQAQYYLKKDLSGTFSKKLLLGSSKYALGIFPSHVVNNFAPLLSKVLLSNLGSLGAVGLLGIALRFVAPLSILQGAFHNAYLPIYYSIRKSNDEKGYIELGKVIKEIWLIACFLFIGSALAFPVLIKLLTPIAYHSSAYLVPFLAIGFLFKIVYTLYGQEIFYSKKTFWVPIMSISAVVVNLTIVFLTVKKLGALGVALGMISSFFVVMIWGVVLSLKMVKIPVEFKIFFKTSLVMILIVGGFYLCREFFEFSLYIELLIAILCAIIFAVIFVISRDIDVSTVISRFKKQ